MHKAAMVFIPEVVTDVTFKSDFLKLVKVVTTVIFFPCMDVISSNFIIITNLFFFKIVLELVDKNVKLTELLVNPLLQFFLNFCLVYI